MVIDSHRDYILTNYKSVKRDGHAKNSDHFTEYMDIDLEFIKEKPEREEFFNFKDKEGQDRFRKITSETEEFTNCFEDGTSLHQLAECSESTLL